MWPNPQFYTDSVTFTEEIYNGKLLFFVQWGQGDDYITGCLLDYPYLLDYAKNIIK